MKKKKTSKLALHRETLRLLERPFLKAAPGGLDTYAQCPPVVTPQSITCDWRSTCLRVCDNELT